jgi:hypothetical protein
VKEPYKSFQRVGVVFAQDSRKRRVHELRGAVDRGLAELKHAVGRARIHKALYHAGIAANGRRDAGRRLRTVGEQVGDFELFCEVHEDRVVVGQGHVEHLDGRRRERVRHATEHAGQHVNPVAIHTRWRK